MASGVSMGVVVRNPPMTSKTTLSSLHEPVTIQDIEDRHRIALETPPVHLGLMGLLFPWMGNNLSPVDFTGQGGGIGSKLGMLAWKNCATFIALPRDRSHKSNCVTIDSRGHPVLHYVTTPEDEKLMMVGLEMNLRIMRSVGAKFMFAAHENFPWYHAEATSPTDDEPARFEEYIQLTKKAGLETAKMQVFSAHQMSSCRMAPTPETGPVSPSGETFECAGLFVADGSVLPTSLGINPMITIESFAHMISRNVLSSISAQYPQLESKIKAFRSKHGTCQW